MSPGTELYTETIRVQEPSGLLVFMTILSVVPLLSRFISEERSALNNPQSGVPAHGYSLSITSLVAVAPRKIATPLLPFSTEMRYSPVLSVKTSDFDVSGVAVEVVRLAGPTEAS